MAVFSVWLRMDPANYLPQVCTWVRTRSGEQRSLMIPGIVCCAVLFLWSQGLEHGAFKFVPCKGFTHGKPMALLCTNMVGFRENVALMWQEYGAIAVVLSDVGTANVNRVKKKFLNMLRGFGRQRQIGPSGSLGIRSGGRLPMSGVARSMRKFPGVKVVWDIVQDIDGRATSSLPSIPTFEPMAITFEGDKFKGLKGHKDNKIVAGAQELFLNQSFIVLWPPPKGLLRAGTAGSFLPVTDWVYRNFLLCAATGYSQTESSMVSRGPYDRPAASCGAWPFASCIGI